MTTKKVMIAEDHPLIIRGLKQIIYSLSPEIEVIDVDNCEDFMTMSNQLKAMSCIVDLNLADGMAFSCIENILNLYPETNIMIYTSFPGVMYAKRLFKLGVNGFLNKSAGEDELHHAIKKFLEEEFYVSPEFLPLMFAKGKQFHAFKTNPFDLLSFKEITVIEYLLQGMSVKDISEKMAIMQNTAATYKKRGFQKLEIENIIQLKSLYESYGGQSKKEESL